MQANCATKMSNHVVSYSNFRLKDYGEISFDSVVSFRLSPNPLFIEINSGVGC